MTKKIALILFLLLSTIGCGIVNGREFSVSRYMLGMPNAVNDKMLRYDLGSVEGIQGGRFRLLQEIKLQSYSIGDSERAKVVWVKFYLVNDVPGGKTLKTWKYERPLLGEIRPSEDKQSLISVFYDDRMTEIFRVSDAGKKVEKIWDFRRYLDDTDANIRNYARRGLALSVLPELEEGRYGNDGPCKVDSRQVEKYKAALGELSVPLAIELLNDDYARKAKSFYILPRGVSSWESKSVTAVAVRAAVLLPVLPADPKEAVMPILQACSRERHYWIAQGKKDYVTGDDETYRSVIRWGYGTHARDYLFEALKDPDPIMKNIVSNCIARIGSSPAQVPPGDAGR